MPQSEVTIEVVCDSSPFQLFAKLLERSVEFGERPLDLGNLGFELFRVESDFDATTTSKLVVRLYPSDRFLRFAATFFARDFDLALVE